MEKILMSACLLGDNCKYNGGNNLTEELKGFLEFYEIVPFCPEMEGGLKTPRDPSEIKGSFVFSNKGKDVTEEFNEGASRAVRLCKYLGIKLAILKERSPSCGVHSISSGRFDGTYKEGLGITAKKLQEARIKILNEEEAVTFLAELRQKKEAIEKARLERENEPKPIKEERRFERKESDKKPFRKSFDGKKPFRKSSDGKKTFDKKDRPHNSFGDKKSYGKKRFSDRSKPNGKRSFGHSRPYKKER